MNNSRTAGIIIIGNEILSGKVRDVNSYYLAGELRSLGVDLKRVCVIPDDEEVIGEESKRFSTNYDYVFTSGGVGPTHDDVTMAGIARGFGVKLVQHEEIRKILYTRYRDQVNKSVLKMTEVPEGSSIDFRENMRFPVITFRNIVIFPGIPEYLRNKFSLIKENFRSSIFHLKRIYLKCHESEIAEILHNTDRKYSDVSFGSYPVLGEDDFRVIITAETKDEDSLKRALDELMSDLPAEVLVRVE